MMPPHQCVEMSESDQAWEYRVGKYGWELTREGSFYEPARGKHPHCEWCGEALYKPGLEPETHQCPPGVVRPSHATIETVGGFWWVADDRTFQRRPSTWVRVYSCPWCNKPLDEPDPT